MNNKFAAIISSFLLCAACAPSNADAWKLDSAHSTISFVSVKKEHVGESHRFKNMDGSLSETGEVEVHIDLNSVDTSVELRDQRMREFLFETAKFPAATVKAKLDPALLKELEAGEIQAVSTQATLDLHGKSSAMDAELLVARLGDDRLMATTTKPVIVNAETFGLVDGVAKLSELVGSIPISRTVPVSFVLVFDR